MKELFETMSEIFEPKKIEMNVTVGMNDNEAFVSVNGIYNKGFNRFSEDYAYNLAKDYASELSSRLIKEGYKVNR